MKQASNLKRDVKKVFLIFSILIFVSCSSTKVTETQTKDIKISYETLKVPIVKDTTKYFKTITFTDTLFYTDTLKEFKIWVDTTNKKVNIEFKNKLFYESVTVPKITEIINNTKTIKKEKKCYKQNIIFFFLGMLFYFFTLKILSKWQE